MKKSYFLFFLTVFAFLCFSCQKKDITPAFILLDSENFVDCVDVSNFNITHETSYNQEELDIIKQHLFQDVFVELNGQSLGYWRLPCKITLLPDYSRENNIRITPCVKFPNSTLTIAKYPFLKPIEKFVSLEKEENYNLSDFKFEYLDVFFPFLETFTQSTPFTSLDTINGANMNIVVEDGKSMGKISLVDTVKYFNVATKYYDLSGQGVRQFWEIYYQCDGKMTAFLNFKNTSTGDHAFDLVVLPPTKSWKKIYIDLTEVISLVSGGVESVNVRLGLEGRRNSDNENAYFYFENMKLISMTAWY